MSCIITGPPVLVLSFGMFRFLRCLYCFCLPGGEGVRMCELLSCCKATYKEPNATFCDTRAESPFIQQKVVMGIRRQYHRTGLESMMVGPKPAPPRENGRTVQGIGFEVAATPETLLDRCYNRICLCILVILRSFSGTCRQMFTYIH